MMQKQYLWEIINEDNKESNSDIASDEYCAFECDGS